MRPLCRRHSPLGIAVRVILGSDVWGCRDDRIKVLMSWLPDFGSDVEIPLNNGCDGVGDCPDLFKRSANSRLEV